MWKITYKSTNAGTKRRSARWPDMPQVRQHLPTVLRNPDMRRACAITEYLFRASDLLDDLPPKVLEQIRDYCAEYVDDRHDTFSEFKRAWIKLVIEHIETTRLRERKLYSGITGKTD